MILDVSQSPEGVDYWVEDSQDAENRPDEIQFDDCWYHGDQGQQRLAEGEREHMYLHNKYLHKNPRAL